MRFTFFVWLYERLTMYNGIKPVDITFHKITINERTENLQFWIDTLLEMTKELLIAYNDPFNPVHDEFEERVGMALQIFTTILCYLWW